MNRNIFLPGLRHDLVLEASVPVDFLHNIMLVGIHTCNACICTVVAQTWCRMAVTFLMKIMTVSHVRDGAFKPNNKVGGAVAQWYRICLAYRKSHSPASLV